MSDIRHDIKEIIEEAILEHELIEESEHKSAEHIFLWVRNIAVLAAVILFVLSLLLHGCSHVLRGCGYILGAIAYIAELFMMTDCFSKKVPHKELFMAYCFGPLYILLGLAYFLEM